MEELTFMVEISVVIGVRNRDEHLDLCLQSLAEQDLKNEEYEVIIVNYGGERATEKLVKSFKKPNFKYIFSNFKGVFNESRSKNCGIKKAKGKFVLSTNADIIFSRKCLSSLKKEYNKNPQNIYMLARYELSHIFPVRKKINALLNDPQKACREMILGPESAMGDFQLMMKKNWVKLKGYDERMIGWGGMDKDLHDRAVARGMKVTHLNPDTMHIFHQFHDWRNDRKPILHNLNVMLQKTNMAYDPLTWGELKSKAKYLIVLPENDSKKIANFLKKELAKYNASCVVINNSDGVFSKKASQLFLRSRCDGIIVCKESVIDDEIHLIKFISKITEEKDIVVSKFDSNFSIQYYNVRSYWILSNSLNSFEKKYLHLIIDMIAEKFDFSYEEISLAFNLNKQIILMRMQRVILRFLFLILIKNKTLI